jgi:hypothetical protein
MSLGCGLKKGQNVLKEKDPSPTNSTFCTSMSVIQYGEMKLSNRKPSVISISSSMDTPLLHRDDALFSDPFHGLSDKVADVGIAIS